MAYRNPVPLNDARPGGFAVPPRAVGSDQPGGAWRAKRGVTRAALAVAIGLVVLKLAAWRATDSVAMLSSLIDSAVDAVASALNMLAVWQAAMPADREHHFGHGKAEALAGLGQSVLILGSAAFLVIEAVPRLTRPEPVAAGGVGIAVMLVAMVASGALVAYQRRVARRTGSLAIAADSVHYSADLLTNLAVIAGIALSAWLGLAVADPIIALAVAAYIGFSAWGILRTAFDQLMDRELPDADRLRIRAIALGHPEILDVHEMRTRMSGNQPFIQFHVAMNAGMPLSRAHAVVEQVEGEIRTAFPGAEVLIHEDPDLP